MDEFISLSRHAFRTLNGLYCAEPPPSVPNATQPASVSWARGHRVLGLLQAGLPATSPSLQSAAFGQTRHSAQLAAEAERLWEILAPALPSLALVKGPGLTAQAWPDSGLRSYDDLDFRCARDDDATLLAGMRSAGYEPEIADARRRGHLWHLGWGLTFRNPAGTMVEINHRFFPPHFPWPRELDGSRPDLFQVLPLDGGSVRVPVPALHLLLACLHAVWHGWGRMGWMADIAGLLVRHPGIFAQAEAWTAGCPFARQALIASCGVAEALFGPGLHSPPPLPAPSEVTIQALVLLREAAREQTGSAQRAIHERFMTCAEKAEYRLRRLGIPGDGDFKWISLPAWARSLYWLLRPVRVALYGRSGS